MVAQKLNYLKVTILGLLLTLACFTLNVQAAFAHYPHDDIVAVEVSPNYQQDRTLLINVRGNILRSQDGGDSWQTIVNGLDHQHELSALDIAAQSPKILFLASLGDGIYKTENGGDSWHKVNQGLATFSFDLVAIAPDLADVVFAAGTEKGLYKTENGGANWTLVMPDNKITAIAFNLAQPDMVVIGDNKGNLFSSRDRGDSWQWLDTLEKSGAIEAVAISPDFALDRTVWVGTEKEGIWQTVDAGASFAQVNNGISDRSIMSLAISPNYQRDRTILASTWQEGVFCSHNGGKSWKKYSKGLTKDGQADLPNFNRPHFSDLSISQGYSQDRTVFMASFDGLFKSTDGGRVWQELNTLSSNIIVGLDVSPDYQNDSTVAITTYLGGAYISHDRGVSWTTINQGLAKDNWLKRTFKQILQDGYVARLFGIKFSPNYRQDKTIFSPSWTYFLRSTNTGQDWQKIPLTSNKSSPVNRPTKYSIAVSPNFASDGTIYLGSMQGTGQDFMLKSTDGGLSFSVVGSINGQSIVYLAISPDFATDQTLYAGVKDGVYKTVDGGKTWQSTGKDIPSMPEENKLTISPNYKLDRTVFAGTAAGVFVTRDEGKSWRKLAVNAATERSYVDAVAISPNFQRDRTLIVSFRGKGLFKSVDGGTTFAQVGENLLNGNHSLANMYGFWPPTMPIKFSPAYSSDRTIYGVAETNLFKSTDGGNTWVNLSLPIPQGTSLKQLITYYYLRLTVAPITKFLLAAIVALASYLILGRLRLNKTLSVRKMLITISGAFTAFMVVFMLFSI